MNRRPANYGVPTNNNERKRIIELISTLSPREKNVLMNLSAFADKQGLCYPSQSLLAKRTGLSIKTVDRALKDLLNKGLIRRARAYRENGQHSVYIYAIRVSSGVAPIGLCVSHGRLFVQHLPDTESSPNTFTEQRFNRALDPYIVFEDELLDRLRGVLWFSRRNGMISAYPISSWLFKQSADQWAKLGSRILALADKLVEEYAENDRQLESWQPLLERISEACSQKPIHNKETPLPTSADPLLSNLQDELEANHQGNRDLQLAVRTLTLEWGEKQLTLSSSSLRDLHMVRDRGSEELKAFSRKHDKPVTLAIQGQVVVIVHP